MEKKLVLNVAETFIQNNKGLSGISIRVGNPKELFGDNANKVVGFQGAYFPKSKLIAINNEGVKSLDGLNKTIRHELIGHAGINTFTPKDKEKLLDAITGSGDKEVQALRAELKGIYPNYPDKRLSEEVYATVSEVEHEPGYKFKNPISKETLDMDSLKGLSRFVSEGLKNGTIEQKIFPAFDKAQFQKEPFYKVVADKLIEQLEQGTAPWQKPWEAGAQLNPINPVTGNNYKGMNALYLSMQGRADNRWLTYKQAKSIDAQVKKGEKSTSITYIKVREEKQVYENGKPLLDSKGDKVKRIVTLEKPKYFSANVFNAEQIEGLPALEKKESTWEDIERAKKLLENSGATIIHDQRDSAFYSPSLDEVHLPPKEQFSTPEKYYATALHELGHWTGHSSRLDRDLTGGNNSENYAKEELRAEISSLMVGNTLSIGHDPGQHAAYVKSWLKTLREDPKEIMYAAKDAEKIHDFILDKDISKTQDVKNASENNEIVSDSRNEEKNNTDAFDVSQTTKQQSLDASEKEIGDGNKNSPINLSEAINVIVSKISSDKDCERFVKEIHARIDEQHRQLLFKAAVNSQDQDEMER